MRAREWNPTEVQARDELAGYRERHCLSVGINLYRHWRRLENAFHDAAEFARVVRDRFDFQVELISEAEATKTRIQEALVNSVPQETKPDDLFILFFAGHGHTDRLPDGRNRGYIASVEARRGDLESPYLSDLISMEELLIWVDNVPARHVLLIFDSCFSGLATVRGTSARRKSDMLRRRARIAITAGGADETVADGGWNNHSVFTGLLLQGLLGDAFEDEQYMTASGLFGYLQARFPDDARQTPTLGTLIGSEGGDIVFEPQGPTPAVFPISLEPPAVLPAGPYRRSGLLTRSSVTDDWAKRHALELVPAESDVIPSVGAGVPIFAERGRQWAVIIGTSPPIVAETDAMPTEFFDANDVLD